MLCLLACFVLAAYAQTNFEKIFIIQFENEAYQDVIKHKNFKALADKGKLLTDYHAVTHPSQPNYIAQTAGSFFNVHNDLHHDLPYTNLVDLMSERINWKGYQEDYPGNCDPRMTIGLYWRKHNPWISFDNVRNNATRCAHIVNADEFEKDLNAGTLPEYSYYMPNIDNCGHNTGLAYADKFLGEFFGKYLDKFPKGTLIVITWDEDDNKHENHIYTALLGSMITPGTKDDTPYTHYSLLRTVEDNWNLGTLGREDAKATPFKF
eukprot:TRINITY_DN3816_c0_g1_i1.p2 TRINITY_DN3816_c0_g1~~TRINITY_DN3816_c0_g1_i1.p2  ORF type:complete len:264 (-),score=57.62 TRINITY_DN3816_c0_g1_i1:56-847(-)